jgi:hypothetical protein
MRFTIGHREQGNEICACVLGEDIAVTAAEIPPCACFTEVTINVVVFERWFRDEIYVVSNPFHLMCLVHSPHLWPLRRTLQIWIYCERFESSVDASKDAEMNLRKQRSELDQFKISPSFEERTQLEQCSTV